MPQIIFLPHADHCPEGAVIEANPGETVLDAALRNGIEIEHACEKSCACTTCHVVIREGFNSLEASDELEDGEDGAVCDNTSMGADGGGDLYSQAVAVVKRDRKASTSYIQRRLQIGYNRAASLMERMENEGIIGQANHAGKREILIPEDPNSDRY